MNQLYETLLTNISIITSLQTQLSGPPTGLQTFINMLYLLVTNDTTLVHYKVNDKLLYDYLDDIAKIVLVNLYHDYLFDQDEDNERNWHIFIKLWIDDTIHYDDFYYSNDAYNLDGVNLVQLQHLFKISKN
jgi:hypothetical protein